MRICFLSSSHPPQDKRVFEKEACTLAEEGFDVFHLAPSIDETVKVINNVTLVTYQGFNGLFSRALGLPKLYKMAHKVDADVYHCNEVDSWLVGLMLKLFSRRACVFDVHEHYPEEFSEVRVVSWLQPLVSGVIRYAIKVLSMFTDRIVVAKSSLLDEFSFLDSGKVIAVQNYSHKSDIRSEGKIKKRDGVLDIVHLGLINRYRGWPQLLEAITLLKKESVRLLVLGSINDGSENDFLKAVSELGLEGVVEYKKWAPYNEAMQMVERSDVGIICFQPGLYNHVHALPHKMFDYMRVGLPVIAPDFAVEVSKIISDSSCGILVDTSDPKSISDAIKRYSIEGVLLQEHGSNGFYAVQDLYNWENEGEKLISMYRVIESDNG